MLFEELSGFTKRVIRLLQDDDYAEFQLALAANPELGKLIKNSGGLRKVRWALPGRGKSGGVRVIYYYGSLRRRLGERFPRQNEDNVPVKFPAHLNSATASAELQVVPDGSRRLLRRRQVATVAA